MKEQKHQTSQNLVNEFNAFIARAAAETGLTPAQFIKKAVASHAVHLPIRPDNSNPPPPKT